MNHGLLVAEDADAGRQALREVAAGDPVSDHMVRGPGQQDLHVYTTGRRGFERVEQDVVWHEIRVGQVDVVFRTVNGLDVHVTDREGQAQRIGAAQGDQRIEVAVVAVC